MKFEVLNSHGRSMMSTEYESCVPYHFFDSMVKAGYKFRVDGKIVARSKVKEAIMQSLGVTQLPSKIEDTSEDKATPDIPSTAETTSSEPVYSKQVRCIDTGKVYKNQSAAAKDLGIDPAQVSDSIKTGRPRSGYTFERVLASEVE